VLARAGACLVVGVTLLAGCGGGGRSRPDLVFVSSMDGVYRLYGMAADGGHQQRVSNEKSTSTAPAQVFFEVEPAWAPNGRSIAFSSTRDVTSHLFVMSADGKDVKRLTATDEADRHPSWSPDGKRIAYVHGFPGLITIMNGDGTGRRSIVGGQAELTDPAWSPDGRWIAYARREPGSPVRELWLIHPDGSGLHQLTRLGAISYWPTWSPDGKRVAFTSDRGGNYDIYSIGVGGSDLRRVTRSPDDDFDPSWSPSGKAIAFARDGSIFTTDLQGHEQQLTGNDNDSNPAWSPVVETAAGY
jgi:Tol biopolymer transport system component